MACVRMIYASTPNILRTSSGRLQTKNKYAGSPEWSTVLYVVVTSPITSSAEFASSILDKIIIFILASVAESVETRVTKVQPFVTRCKSAELASR